MKARWGWAAVCLATWGCAQVSDEEAAEMDRISSEGSGGSESEGPGDASSGSGGVSDPTTGSGATGGGLVGGETGGASGGSGASASGGSAAGGTSSSGGSSSTGGTTGAGGTASTGGSTASGGSTSSGGSTASGGSSSSADPGSCLAGWETTPEGDACLNAGQSDWVDGCTNALDCWQANDCTPSECSSSPDDTCGQNSINNFNAGKSYADQVYAALCN